jgi:hypothetical protein
MSWTGVRLQVKADILRQIHAIEPHQRFHPEGAVVDMLSIPFYPEGLLIRCRDMSWRSADDCLWYVTLPKQEIIALDGSIANIHRLNFYAPLCLTVELLPAYLKFRLYFGKEGQHRRYLMGDKSVEIENAGADFICICSFYEERRLYTGRFKISPRGEIELLEKIPQPAKLNLTPMPEFTF